MRACRWDWKTHDWTITEHLRELAINVKFVKGGKPVYYGLQYAGYAGILTAVKPVQHTFTFTSTNYTYDIICKIAVVDVHNAAFC